MGEEMVGHVRYFLSLPDSLVAVQPEFLLEVMSMRRKLGTGASGSEDANESFSLQVLVWAGLHQKQS